VLPKSVGDALSLVTDVCQMYGSVETGQIQLLVPEKGDWEYMEFNPFEEVDMQLSDDGAYEMVLHQRDKFKKHRSISHNFPDLKEWRSGDLFLQHPTKLGLWQYHGRIDDLIVLANSHKINPVAFETGMLDHPLISGALMVGTKRAQPALLLEFELEATSKTKEELISEVWPLVEKANALIPHYGFIAKSKIIFSDHRKPFIRAPKGSIVRKPTIALYATEIEDVYSGKSHDTANEQQLSSPDTIKNWIRSILNGLLLDTKLEDDDDIFARGLDSLKITELTNTLRRTCRLVLSESPAITSTIIYQHPNINQLANAISVIILGDTSMNYDAGPSMESLVQCYSQFPSLPQKKFVLLTGATGSLGSQVLRRLLQDPDIEKVYCLVRWKPGRQIDTVRKNYRETFPKVASRVKFVEVDFSKEKLGVNDEIHNVMCSGIDAIIHLAWTVDFNLSLQSFEKTHLRGLQSLISISVSSRRKPPIVFASSAAYAVSWAINQGTKFVPESLLPIDENVSCTGYGKSKHVAELMLAAASQKHGVPVTILRLGQIAGSDTSVANTVPRAWSKNEWVPSMIQTAKSLNLIPTSQIPIDWVPGSNVADILGEVVSSGIKTSTQTLQVANVVHDNAAPWTSFVHALQQELPSAKIVSMREWVDTLGSYDANDASQLGQLPALKLKDYFEGLAKFDDLGEDNMPRFEVNTAHALSKTIGKFLDAINDDVIRRWVKEFI
jgi:thioester reductase-like protein